jgi:hypothetical protein
MVLELIALIKSSVRLDGIWTKLLLLTFFNPRFAFRLHSL